MQGRARRQAGKEGGRQGREGGKEGSYLLFTSACLQIQSSST